MSNFSLNEGKQIKRPPINLKHHKNYKNPKPTVDNQSKENSKNDVIYVETPTSNEASVASGKNTNVKKKKTKFFSKSR